MQETATGRSSPIAAILGLVGGGIMIVGSFLAWAEVSGGGTSVTAKGTDGNDGWITVAAGGVLVLVGIAWLVRGAGKKALAVLAILAGLVGGGVGLYDAVTAKDSTLDGAAEELAVQFGQPVSDVRALLDQAIDAGQISISLSIGIYLVIAGGAIGIVGGIVGLRGRPPVAAPAAAPGFAPTMPMAATEASPAPPTEISPGPPTETQPPSMPQAPPAPPPPPPGPGDPSS